MEVRHANLPFYYSINFIELCMKGKLMQLKNTRIALVLSNAVVTANFTKLLLFRGPTWCAHMWLILN